jgi:hypothetical protein
MLNQVNRFGVGVNSLGALCARGELSRHAQPQEVVEALHPTLGSLPVTSSNLVPHRYGEQWISFATHDAESACSGWRSQRGARPINIGAS